MHIIIRTFWLGTAVSGPFPHRPNRSVGRSPGSPLGLGNIFGFAVPATKEGFADCGARKEVLDRTGPPQAATLSRLMPRACPQESD
jgi:hypothetical protein